MVVTVINGIICDDYGTPYEITDADSGISGWGFLDSPDAYIIGEILGSNVLIPKAIIDGLIEMIERANGR